MSQTTREELLGICRDGFVPQEKWNDRDSARAQMQLGQAYALLSAGCDYSVRPERETLWVRIEYRGFDWFEGGYDYDEPRDAYLDHNEFYLPTRERLTQNAGSDWY
ncbi:hypothetical protein [Mycobacterium sp. SMC-13]|uniref:hypothetical protein n=1 Tax=Mycobacterium sp. SMC-13 TaxID=3381626 RepID=UPI0038761D4C